MSCVFLLPIIAFRSEDAEPYLIYGLYYIFLIEIGSSYLSNPENTVNLMFCSIKKWQLFIGILILSFFFYYTVLTVYLSIYTISYMIAHKLVLNFRYIDDSKLLSLDGKAFAKVLKRESYVSAEDGIEHQKQDSDHLASFDRQ